MKICSCKDHNGPNPLPKKNFHRGDCKGGFACWCKECGKQYKRNRYIRKKKVAKQGFKICSSCGKEKQKSAFYNNRSRIDGLNAICKKCCKDKYDKDKQTKGRVCSYCGKLISFSSKSGFCKSCSKKGKEKTDEHKKKISRATAKRYQTTSFGKHSNGYRSNWECLVAQWFNENGIDFQYEPSFFQTGYGGYIPDFYLPEFDLYVEVKGWKRESSMKKFKDFTRRFDAMLWDERVLQLIGII